MTTGEDTMAMVATFKEDDDNNNIADETHNYSCCSDEYSTSSPMIISPKMSTRTLIDFWTNPHESGMTMSFSQYDKSATGTSSEKSPSENISNNSNQTIGVNLSGGNCLHSLNYSPETSLGCTPEDMKMLLDVTCDDEERDHVTEDPEELCVSDHSTSDNGALPAIAGVESNGGENKNPTTTIENNSVTDLDEISDSIPFIIESKEILVAISQTPIVASDGDGDGDISTGDISTATLLTIAQLKEVNDVPPASVNGSPRTANRVTPLPPLPPSARRLHRNVPTITREQYIAKAIEKRLVTPTLPPDIQAVDALSTCVTNGLFTTHEIPTTDISLPTIQPENVQSTQASVQISFLDTSLSTIHGEAERSFDAEMENNNSHGDDSPTNTPTKHPFSPEREVTLPDDDELDLTSIHSEDSDGEVLQNTRHHIIDIVDNHQSLIQDVCIPFPQGITNPDDKHKDHHFIHGDKRWNDDVPLDTQPRNPDIHEENDGSLIHDVCTETPPSIRSSIVATEANDLSISKEDIELGNSREHNRSNDTENMLANVIDAAEKSILKSQEEQIFVPAYHHDPSMFFDCEEYDATSSQTHPNESALPLKFMTLNDPLSPLATINDGKVYDSTSTVLKNYDIYGATSPLSYPSEHLFTRVTPLRSNSSRTEDVSRISSTTETTAGQPLKKKKKIARKKLLPRIVANSSQKSDNMLHATNHEYQKREKRSSPEKMVDVDDDDLSSSVSTLEMDYEKDESTDHFWIDAFLDFVSPPEDSRSVDSDSSTSTGTGSNGVTIRNIDASAHIEHGRSQKQFQSKRKPPTSLSRLRDWWQKELIEEVMKGNLAKPIRDIETDSVDPRGSNDTVEKLVSKEFHKVLYGQKVSLLSAKKSTKQQEKPTKNATATNWLESLRVAIESATSASLVCGASESTISDEEPRAYDTVFTASVKSFDSLDDLVRELKNTKIETDPTVLRGHFQSLYDQLQQKLHDAHLFDQAAHAVAAPSSSVKPDISNIDTSTFNEKGNDDRPCVEVLPEDSLQFLLHSTASMYSAPTSDYLQQSTSNDVPSPRLSGKSKTRVAKALAQAKAALAQRRRAASILHSEVTKDVVVQKSEIEVGESLRTIKEDAELSVALEDLDISMEDDNNLADSRATDMGDDVRVIRNDPSSNFSDVNATDSFDTDVSILEIGDSGAPDNTDNGNDSIQREDRQEDVSADGIGNNLIPCHTFSAEISKDFVDKRNVTKETVTDNSGTEDSIDITSKVNQLVLLRSQAYGQVDETSLWQNTEPHLDDTAVSGSATANESHMTTSGEYHPLDSSEERQWRELSTSGPSDQSSDQVISAELPVVPSRQQQICECNSSNRSAIVTSLSLRSRGHRSSSLKTIATLATDDTPPQKHRIGFKSKAFRKAESYVAMHAVVDIDNSLSTSRSSTTSNSEHAISPVKPSIQKDVISTASSSLTMTSKLTRNASKLFILRKKSRRNQASGNNSDVLKETLINTTERGSDDDTSPHGNDFDWEEFPTNQFFASNNFIVPTKAEV